MRKVLMALLIAAAAPTLVAAAPAAADATAKAGFNVETTDLGTLLDDAGAKAVLTKHLPALVGNDQITMARSMTLKQLQQFAGDAVTDEKLAAIQVDLDKLPKH